jgi:hypothetical protein
MIRTVILTAALLAVAGVADAATVKVSLAGKTEAAIKAELTKAAETVCSEAPVIEYAACVQETYQDAMVQVAKVKAMRTASLAF